MAERLAIDGGTPIRSTLLPYGRQLIDEDDIQAVVNALRGDWLTTGPEVAAYERAFADYVGAEHAVAMSSGTAALHTALAVAGVGPGDEVITSPITFVASANCALYCGATPRFADVQPDTCSINPERIQATITEKTKVIVPVDFTGRPADLDEILALAEAKGLVVVEDACQALGATYKGRKVGAISPMTVFSTHPVKHIATGEGGVITTNDSDIAGKLRAFRNHGITTDARQRQQDGEWLYAMTMLGYNYRIPDILCALGRTQLQKLDSWLERLRVLASRYDDAFADMPEIGPLAQRPDRQSAWHIYVVRLALDRLRADRARIFKALRAEGIGVNVHHIPVYRHPHYEDLGYAKGLCPVAEEQYARLLTLPLWAGMTDADADDVITAVHKVVQVYRR